MKVRCILFLWSFLLKLIWYDVVLNTAPFLAAQIWNGRSGLYILVHLFLLTEFYMGADQSELNSSRIRFQILSIIGRKKSWGFLLHAQILSYLCWCNYRIVFDVSLLYLWFSILSCLGDDFLENLMMMAYKGSCLFFVSCKFFELDVITLFYLHNLSLVSYVIKKKV